MLFTLLRDEERRKGWRESEGGSAGCGDDGRDGWEGSIAAAPGGGCCCRRAAASSRSTAATPDIGETEAEWGGGGGEKGLAGMLGVLLMEGCCSCCGSWGDTKGLAGVTKGMTVRALET